MRKKISPHILLCILIFLVMGAYAASQLTSYIFFKHQRSAFTVSEVTVANQAYSIKDGAVFFKTNPATFRKSAEVLRVAYAAELTRLDPLLGLEGTDPEALRSSVTFLNETTKEIGARYPNRERMLIESLLQPAAFLQSLADLEAIRQRFINAPSDTALARYSHALATSISLFRESVHALNAAVTNGKQQYHFINGFTTPTAFKAYLADLEENARKLGDLAKQRTDCFNGSSLACPNLGDVLDVEPLQHSLLKEPSQAVARNQKILRQYNTVFGKGSRTTSEFLVALAESSCFPTTAPVYYLPWETYRNGNTSFNMGLVNDIFFYTVESSESPHLSKLKTAGVEALYQPLPSFYMCPESPSDFAAVATLIEIRALLSKATVFLDDTPLSILENQITREPLLREADVVEYLTRASHLLKSDRAALRREIGTEKITLLEKLISMKKQQSVRLDTLVMNAAERRDFLATIQTHSPRMPVEDLLIGRTFTNLFFLTFNGSAGNDPYHFMQEHNAQLSAFNLRPYSEIGLAADTLIEVMNTGRQKELKLVEYVF